MSPGQLSRRLRGFLFRAVCLVKMPHTKEVSAGEAALTWLASSKIRRQLLNNAVAPFRGRNLLTDLLADLPVQIDYPPC